MNVSGDGLVIGDLHTPYHHPAAIDWLADLKRLYKPKYVVCIGDEIDAYSFSHYVRSPDMPSAVHEMVLALRALKQLYKVFPRVMVCNSNHTYRIYARALEAGVSQQLLRTIPEILHAPRGWQWADRWVVNGVLHVHGDGYSGDGAHTTAALQNRSSTVIGHVHSLQAVSWLHGRQDAIFGAATGCLIDDSSLAFAYAKHSAKRPALGSLLVHGGIPIPIPLLLP